MELINKKKFAKTILDANFEPFVLHVAALEALLIGITIHLFWVVQIIDNKSVQVVAL